MDQPFATSKVAVEYHDPYGLFKLLEPGLASRLPLRNLHWQSHFGPLRSIDTLHVDLVPASQEAPASTVLKRADSTMAAGDDSLPPTTATTAGSSSVSVDAVAAPAPAMRRHQIPGLRQTPYLKVLLVRCDDNDSYKARTRAEIREWIKHYTVLGSGSSKKSAAVAAADNHDAFEWMIVHVVIPNTVAYTQPRTTRSVDGSASDGAPKTASLWGKSSATILDRLRADFNGTSGSGGIGTNSVGGSGGGGGSSSSGGGSGSSSGGGGGGSGGFRDRITQIRIGLNEVPYDMLPQAPLPAAATSHGHSHVETEKEALAAWADVIDKFKALILASFDARVSQYEEDIREKDLQRALPGWNFCTFFILKEGLARGFESVGLVDDALVGYDELSVGLDTIVKNLRSSVSHGGTLLPYTDELRRAARQALQEKAATEALTYSHRQPSFLDDIPISSAKKPYRDLILANNISVFDFRCYIFVRQVALLLRLGNANAAGTTASKENERREDFNILAEICRRALEFIPAISRVMRQDIINALVGESDSDGDDDASNDSKHKKNPLGPVEYTVIDSLVSSYAFSIAQQILDQTAAASLPLPPSTWETPDGHEPKASIPELKTMMHPARSSSLQIQAQSQNRRPSSSRPPPSPGIFPGPGQPPAARETDEEKAAVALKAGAEHLATRRADLYILSRNILEKLGETRGWSDGWLDAPVLDTATEELVEISLDNEPRPGPSPSPSTKNRTRAESVSGPESETESETETETGSDKEAETENSGPPTMTAGTAALHPLLYDALATQAGFQQLYGNLTDLALRHYSLAGQMHSLHACLADLAVLSYHAQDYAAAASYFYEATPFFGEDAWRPLELSMLIMYARCLRETQRKEEYARTLLKLLAKVSEVQRDCLPRQIPMKVRVEDRSAAISAITAKATATFGPSVVQDAIQDLLAVSRELASEIRVPMASFFTSVTLQGAPIYASGEDSFSLVLSTHSLLPEKLPVDRAMLHLVSRPNGSGPSSQARDIWLETRDALQLSPGQGVIQFHSNTIVPGIYDVDQVRISSSNIVIFYDQRSSAAATAPVDNGASLLKDSHVLLYQRTSALDVRLNTARHLHLDRTNCLELELQSGWNDISHCELRIRAASGGLRLLTAEAQVVGDVYAFAKPVDGSIMSFEGILPRTLLQVLIPFSIEQDVLDLAIRVEVSYTTPRGTFTFSKTPSVSTSLMLGVNVQDVFKHDALFSKFSVSTATASPLRLFRAELIDSDLFCGELGIALPNPTTIYPKQPASLLYKITRKSATALAASMAMRPGKALKKTNTMYIKLHYSVVHDEIDAAIEASLARAFADTPALAEFSRMATACVLRYTRSVLTAYELERVALVGAFPTSLLDHLRDWRKEFPGLGLDPAVATGGQLWADQIAGLIEQWKRKNRMIPVPAAAAMPEPRTILIPVDIPSITIVHTTDILIQPPQTLEVEAKEGEEESNKANGTATMSMSTSPPVFCVNQLLPATLHMQWTRAWDTTEAAAANNSSNKKAAKEDLEFSFEVSAPADAWMIGGRRKGHFVIPAAATSAAESEASIPLVLIPLREGWLPYPSVDIREVVPVAAVTSAAASATTATDVNVGHQCETDNRNLGETVHVITDRQRVTLSLDASGPGGGPLVLESERSSFFDGLVV